MRVAGASIALSGIPARVVARDIVGLEAGLPAGGIDGSELEEHVSGEGEDRYAEIAAFALHLGASTPLLARANFKF